MPGDLNPPAIPAVPSTWRFPADPASVRRARRAVTEALPYDTRSQLTADVTLLTSELVTNAVQHGAHREDEEVIELVLWEADGHCWLAVSDPGGGKPELAPADPDPDPGDERGRGLVLVDALAAAWAVAPRRTRGKSVIAGVRLPPAG